MTVEPLSPTEIVKSGLTGGWAGQGITAANAWFEQRRLRSCT